MLSINTSLVNVQVSEVFIYLNWKYLHSCLNFQLKAWSNWKAINAHCGFWKIHISFDDSLIFSWIIFTIITNQICFIDVYAYEQNVIKYIVSCISQFVRRISILQSEPFQFECMIIWPIKLNWWAQNWNRFLFNSSTFEYDFSSELEVLPIAVRNTNFVFQFDCE